jgi:hypothetical protein
MSCERKKLSRSSFLRAQIVMQVDWSHFCAFLISLSKKENRAEFLSSAICIMAGDRQEIYPCCWSSTKADLPGLPVAPSMPYFGVCGASGASMPDCGVLGGPS